MSSWNYYCLPSTIFKSWIISYIIFILNFFWYPSFLEIVSFIYSFFTFKIVIIKFRIYSFIFFFFSLTFSWILLWYALNVWILFLRLRCRWRFWKTLGLSCLVLYLGEGSFWLLRRDDWWLLVFLTLQNWVK